jgi:hypothetical protein
MPALEIFEIGEPRLSAVQVIAENAVQIVIDEERAIAHQVRRRREQVIHRREQVSELTIQIRAVSRPLLDAALAELPLFEPGDHDSFDDWERGDDIAVVDFETDSFQVILDVSGKDRLNSFFVSWEQAEPVFAVNVSRHFLSEVGEIGDGGFTIDKAGNGVGAAVCRADDGFAGLRRNVPDAM